MELQDAVIVGGGPAGLSAALTLGRALRRVLLVDGGRPRNARAHEVHTFVTRDGIPPAEFRRVAREQLVPYETVAVRDALVTKIVTAGSAFEVSLEGGATVRARKVLLATGVVDVPPEIEGMADYWGRFVFQCPYCHGFEMRGRSWGVVVTTDALAEWAFMLLGWTRRLVAFTDGATLSAEVLARLARAGVAVETDRLAALAGDGPLASVVLRSGKVVPCEALFLKPAQHAVALVDALGLERDEQGYVRVDSKRESNVKGIFVAGDATTMMQSALGAAAEGMLTAAMLNHALAAEDVAAR
jgi:thioredoxin reductase